MITNVGMTAALIRMHGLVSVVGVLSYARVQLTYMRCRLY